jgi:hypothetical protein
MNDEALFYLKSRRESITIFLESGEADLDLSLDEVDCDDTLDDGQDADVQASMDDDAAVIDDQDVFDFEEDMSEEELGVHSDDDFIDGDYVDEIPQQETTFSDDEEGLANLLKDVLS